MLLDPRSVANIVIGEAHLRGSPITNLSLQKILYFIQGRFLIENEQPLISGFFEAWQYGPVHPLLYDTFKANGSGAIKDLAFKRDLLTGRSEPVDPPADETLAAWIRDVAAQYLRLSAGRLVDLSHARDSPWDVLTRAPNGARKYGLRITHDMLRARFKYHKVSIGPSTKSGEPDEESPPH